MKTQDVIDHFGGNRSAAAKALGIDPSAIHHWGEDVPELRQFQVQVITQGVLRVDSALCSQEPVTNA